MVQVDLGECTLERELDVGQVKLERVALDVVPSRVAVDVGVGPLFKRAAVHEFGSDLEQSEALARVLLRRALEAQSELGVLVERSPKLEARVGELGL